MQAIRTKNRKERRSILGKFKKWMRRSEVTKGAFGQPHNDIIREYNIAKNKENAEKHAKKPTK
jgi:hypothetical protein